jgi:hypothetical protein
MACRGIIVAEGEFEGFAERDTPELLAAFGEGMAAGAARYGAGMCSVFTRDDLKLLVPDDPEDRRLIELIEQHLPAGD